SPLRLPSGTTSSFLPVSRRVPLLRPFAVSLISLAWNILVGVESHSGVGGIVHHTLDAALAGAMGAAVDITTFSFHAVTEDPATALAAGRRESMNGAFKGIKVIAYAVHGDFEGVTVDITAAVTN